MLAHHLGYAPLEFIHTIGDAHIYTNHLNGVKELMSRTPGPLPKLKIKAPRDKALWDYEPSDFELIDYDHQGKIPFPIAV